MRHLDAIGDNHLSKSNINRGPISAHFYTLLVVKINEDKSSINQNDLTDKELKDAILDIETLFPYLTINHFGSSVDKIKLFAELTSKYKDYHPEYLGKFNRYEIDKYIQEISKSYKKEVMKMAENQAKKEQVHTVFQNISQNTIDSTTS